MKVKEFTNEISVEKEVNVWLTKSKNINVIDIKYSADQHSSNALIIYEEDSEGGKQHSKK